MLCSKLHAALTSLKDYLPNFNVTETGTGTGNRRICLLYISIKFSHYSGSGTGNRTATNILTRHFCTLPDPLEGTLYSILSVSCPCCWSQSHSHCQFENFGIKSVLVPLRLKFWLNKPQCRTLSRFTLSVLLLCKIFLFLCSNAKS